MRSESAEAIDSTSEEELDAISIAVGELERVALLLSVQGHQVSLIARLTAVLVEVSMQNIAEVIQDRADDEKV